MALRIVRHISKRYDIPMQRYLKRLTMKSTLLHAELFEVDVNAAVPTVRCTDTAEFLRRVCELRETPLDNCTLIVGVDRGDDTLKLSVTVVENNEEGVPVGSSVGDGEFLTSGVRRILVLAAAATEENYESVSELLEVLQGVDCSIMKFAVDHKMKAELCGIAGGAATHWCDLCEYDNADNDNANVARAKQRTWQRMRDQNNEYRKSNG